MKYLRYVDDLTGWATVHTITREEAIRKQKITAKVYDQAIYKTDEHALAEFMHFNDAYWVEIDDDGKEIS